MSRPTPGDRIDSPSDPVPIPPVGGPPTRHLQPGGLAFLALLAGLMTMTAMTLDINLPAIPTTAADLGASLTRSQLTVTLFFVGFALGQVVWGPLADRYGRKPPLVVGIVLFVLTSLACALAVDMTMLLLMRVAQGAAAGAGSVLARTIVRDLFAGPQMARVMSLVQAAFVTAPIVAPVIGAGLLALGSWRLIFLFLTLYGLVLLALTTRLLPESLPPGGRRPLGLGDFVLGYRAVFGRRESRWWALLVVAALTMLTIYLANAPALFMAARGFSEAQFAGLFAAIAVGSAMGNLLNARLVRNWSPARATALALTTVTTGAALALLAEIVGPASGLWLVPGLGLIFVGFGPIVANGTALALQPHGAIAGTANSAMGVVQTAIPAGIASIVAGLYDGTGRPMLLAILAAAIAGVLCFRAARSAAAGSQATGSQPS